MSAETLRRAAALMRDRAEAVTIDPWQTSHDDATQVWDERERLVASAEGLDEAAHIASWHPAVAFAVANLLDDTADALGSQLATGDDPEQDVLSLYGSEIAVARAYLGEAT